MSAPHRCLVIENDPTDGPGRLGDWLTAAGLELDVVAAYAGQPVPVDIDGYAALLVLGGDQHAFTGADGAPGAPWFPALESLLRKAVRARVATLGVCLGAQLLAVAHAGRVEQSAAGPEIGAHLVAKRDVAERDPLFAPLPMLPDVLQWHYDEVVELPAGAVLLAASTRYPHQAFRIGDRAWGLQFHIECDTAMFASWAVGNEAPLATVGLTPETVVAAVDAVMDDLEEVWRPFAARFAALARGELVPGDPMRPELPLLGHPGHPGSGDPGAGDRAAGALG
jgi:GMP synthase-like glutamine amidotransferase